MGDEVAPPEELDNLLRGKATGDPDHIHQPGSSFQGQQIKVKGRLKKTVYDPEKSTVNIGCDD